MTLPSQTAFRFPHTPSYDSEIFLVCAANQEAWAWLERPDEWPESRLVLWGPAGCGKTHLLHVWSRRTAIPILKGSAIGELPAPPAGPVAVDDADQAHEVGLFHLLNACRDAGHRVLLTASRPPARWPIRLPDLASRLRATTAVEIHEPDDAALETLLVRALADRELTMTDAARKYLVARMPRSASDVRDTVANLDMLQLAARGQITRSLAAGAVAPPAPDEMSVTNDGSAVKNDAEPLSIVRRSATGAEPASAAPVTSHEPSFVDRATKACTDPSHTEQG